jgi:ribosome-binding protein aMBF1 (putative translation factor)
MADCQDWKNIVIHGTTAVKSKMVSEQPKKVFVGTKEQGIVVDPETDEVKIITVDKEFSKQILQARLSKKMTQEQLAKALSLGVDVIKKYENGTARHNGGIVSKIKKYLNIHK